MNYEIDTQDLQILFLKVQFSIDNLSFDEWVKQVKKDYLHYIQDGRKNIKSFSKWINGQIIAMDYV